MLRRLSLCLRILFGRHLPPEIIDASRIHLDPCRDLCGAVNVTAFGRAIEGRPAGVMIRLSAKMAADVTDAMNCLAVRAMDPARN